MDEVSGSFAVVKVTINESGHVTDLEEGKGGLVLLISCVVFLVALGLELVSELDKYEQLSVIPLLSGLTDVNVILGDSFDGITAGNELVVDEIDQVLILESFSLIFFIGSWVLLFVGVLF